MLAPGPAAVEDAVAAPAGTAALLLTGWLALVVAMSAASALWPGLTRRSPWLAAASRALAPALLRHGLAVLLGASTALSSAPGPTCTLGGCAAPAVARVSAEFDPGDLDPGWWPEPPGPEPPEPDEVVGGLRHAPARAA